MEKDILAEIDALLDGEYDPAAPEIDARWTRLFRTGRNLTVKPDRPILAAAATDSPAIEQTTAFGARPVPRVGTVYNGPTTKTGPSSSG